MKKLSQKKYIKQDGICPVCGSIAITRGEFDLEGHFCEMDCACGATWQENYKMTGYDNVVKP